MNNSPPLKDGELELILDAIKPQHKTLIKKISRVLDRDYMDILVFLIENSIDRIQSVGELQRCIDKYIESKK